MHNMILGISSFTYGWAIGLEGFHPAKPMTEKELLDMAIDMGLNCVQIGDNLPLHLIDKSRLDSLRNALISNNIRLEVGARGLTVDNLDRYINLAAFFNAPLLRFVIDGEGYCPNFDSIVQILRQAEPELKKNRMILGIENHDRLKCKEFARILDTVGSNNIGICLDCVNSMGAGEGLEHVAEVLAPYTVNLHIKDFSVTRLPYKMGFTITGAQVGQGLLDLDYLMQKLSDYKLCQSAILEQWVPPEEHLEISIEKERIWASNGIEYLKTLDYFKHI